MTRWRVKITGAAGQVPYVVGSRAMLAFFDAGYTLIADDRGVEGQFFVEGDREQMVLTMLNFEIASGYQISILEHTETL